MISEQPSRPRCEHGRVRADFFGASSVASALGIRAGATPGGQSLRPAALQRQAVLAVNLHDPTRAAGLADGHLRGPFGTFGEIHDLAAQLGVTR